MIALLRRNAGRALTVMLTACVAFSAAWLALIRPGSPPEVPFGQKGQSSGVSLQMLSMTVTTSYADQFGKQVTLLPGASAVIVEMWSDSPPGTSCTVLNLQGDGRYWPISQLPSTFSGATFFCNIGQGTIEAIFQVPTTALGEITGVMVATGPHAQVLMLGNLT